MRTWAAFGSTPSATGAARSRSTPTAKASGISWPTVVASASASASGVSTGIGVTSPPGRELTRSTPSCHDAPMRPSRPSTSASRSASAPSPTGTVASPGRATGAGDPITLVTPSARSPAASRSPTLRSAIHPSLSPPSGP